MNINSQMDYVLEVRIPDQTPTKYAITEQMTAGLDPRNEIILIDPKVKAQHYKFTKKDQLLTLQFLGGNKTSFLNGLALEQNKTYLLEIGDILKVGKISITILFEIGTPKTFATHQKVIPSEIENIKIDIPDMPIVSKKQKISRPDLNYSSFKLIPYKIYGFIVDVSLTYLILGFVIPKLGILDSTFKILFPISNFIIGHLFIKYPEVSALKILSTIEFFICFHFFMISSSLILGTTPGAFFIGLHHDDKDKSILALRFKAYIYALLNVIALPLIIFDIPFFNGKTVKELLTFSTRQITSSTFFTISRRAITPLFVIACYLSPFFMSPPFTSNITEEKLLAPKYKDQHTDMISSTSSYFGLDLKAELNEQYRLLPFFSKNKIGLVLYDLKNNKSITIKEENRLNLSIALFKLRYANPIASLTIPNENISNEVLKNKAVSSLTLNLDHFFVAPKEFGPFIANSFLFKYNVLKDFSSVDNFTINTFDKKNPALLISSSTKKSNEQKIFLFSNREIIQFRLTPPKETKLIEVLSSQVLKGLRFNQATSYNKSKDPKILEVLEAFSREDYQTVLTYYIIEAKKTLEKNDMKNNTEWKAFLVKNILQTKNSLSGDKNKNIEKSFDDIIRTYEKIL